MKTSLKKYIIEESDSDNLKIEKIIDNTMRNGGVNAELKLLINNEWKKMICELDTGASVCIIGKENLQKMYGKENVTYKQSTQNYKVLGEQKYQ